MGDRFYMQQKEAGRDKPGRRLKAHIIEDINKILGTKVNGLDKCTIVTLDELTTAINVKLHGTPF